MGSPHDVFVSYSSPEREFAEAVLATLEADGIRCWIAPRDIVPGDDWGGTIVSAISTARVLVLIYSSRSNASPQVLREVERAVSKGLTILPVRIENIAPTGSMEYFLGACHWLDAFEPPFEDHLEALLAAVRSALQRPTTAPAARPTAHPTRRGCSPMLVLAIFLVSLVVAGMGARWALSHWPRNARGDRVAQASPQVSGSPAGGPTAASPEPQASPPRASPPQPSPRPVSPRPMVALRQPRIDRVSDPGGAEVRKARGASSPSLGRADEGDLLLVLEESDDWLRVVVPALPSGGQKTGYVERSRVRTTTLRPVGVATISDPDGFTNVRSGPGLDRPVVARVREREIVIVLGSGEWVRVVTRKGIEGFMHRSRLRPMRPT